MRTITHLPPTIPESLTQIGPGISEIMVKGGIFDTGLGEILRSFHLQRAGKRKFAPRFTKPSVTDPLLDHGTPATYIVQPF